MKCSVLQSAVIALHVAVTIDATVVTSEVKQHDSYNLQPFHINLSDNVPHMLDLIRKTNLPAMPEYPDVGDSAGIDLNVLKSLRTQWLNRFDWDKEQASMNKSVNCTFPTYLFSVIIINSRNRFDHYTAEIEGLTTHFIHAKSSDPDALPLVLNHGWPGSFLEFTPIVNQLTQKAQTSTGKSVSFHIVVPSLPGFAFSSAPPANWTVDDTARVHNTLMTKVLGYKTFAAHGTDWGVGPSYSLYDNFNETTRAAHFTFIPFFPSTPEQLKSQGIKLKSALEKFEEQRFVEWSTKGNGYFAEQATKVR